MAVDPIYKHIDHNKQEIRNVSFEKLAAHPTGPDLYEGRFWQLTADDHVYHYSGGVVRQIANIDDLNKYGALIGGHDASGGTVPTQGSGLNEQGAPDLSIEAGDSWRITTAGTIAGLASGDAELEVGDLLIALVDSATTAADFMAVQLNLDDAILDEVQNYADLGSFPGTGQTGVVYIANDTNEAYVWDGAAYSALSLPNIEHYGTLGSFPGTGDMDILYIADDSNLVYFWDGAAYIPVSGIFSNFYSIDGTLTGNRTVSGGSNNLTFTGILAFTLSTATYDLVTAGNADESIGGNKTVTVVGTHNETSGGKTTTVTGAGNNINHVTDPDGAWIAPSDSNPDGNISTPVAGMVKYDITDDHFRFYENGAWRTFGSEINIQHAANFAAFPVTGDPDIFYIADDTNLVYFWDGATYQIVGGGSIYTNDGTVGSGRTATVTDTLTWTGGTTISTLTSTGETVTAGTGQNPIGFGSFGDLNLVETAGQFDGFSGIWINSNNPRWEAQAYDNTTFIEKASHYIAIADFSGTDRPYAGVYYTEDGVAANYKGFEANINGERILSQAASFTRNSAPNVADGIAFLNGTGDTGYVDILDQTGFATWIGTTLDPDLATVLGVGNISGGTDIVMTSGDVIRSSIASRGQLNLRDGGDYIATLTNDGGSQGKEGVYLDDSFAAFFANGWSQAYQMGQNYLIAYAGSGVLNIREDASVLFTGTQGVNIIDHSTNSFSSNAVTGETGSSISVLINSGNSTLADNTGAGIRSRNCVILGGSDHNLIAGVDNTVILGGSFSNASKSDSAYVTQIVHYNTNIGGADTILQFAGATASTDKTQTFQDASGTIALLSDIPALQDLQSVLDEGSTGSVATDISITKTGASLSTSLTLNDTAAQLTQANSGTSITSRFSVDDVSGTQMQYVNGLNQQSAVFNGSAMTIRDAINSKGLVYISDYSAAGTADPRWIPDYGAVTSAIAALSTLYSADDSLSATRTVDMNTFQLTFNNGDFLVETDSADAYIAAIGDQIVLGGSDHVWVDTGRLQLGGPFTGGTPEIYWNDGANIGQLVSAHTGAVTWTLPDETGVLPVGPGWNTLVANPTITQDGYAITWDNTGGEYTLTNISTIVDTLYSANGTLAGNRTVDFNSNTLTFDNGDFTVEGTSDANLFNTDFSANSLGFGVAANTSSKVGVTGNGFATGLFVSSNGSGTAAVSVNGIATKTDGVSTGGLFEARSANSGTGGTNGQNNGLIALAYNATGASGHNVAIQGATNSQNILGGANDVAVHAFNGNGTTTATTVHSYYGQNSQTNCATKYGIRQRMLGDQASGTGYGIQLDFDTTFTSGTGYGIDIDFGGTTPTKYGVRIVMNEGGTTHYGVYLDVAGATTDYGFVTNAPLNGLGTFSPDALLEINGGQMYVAQTTDTMSTNAFTVDWDQGNNTVVDLQGSTGTVTATLSNPKAGAWYTIKIIQGSNLDTITWPGTVLWPGGTAPTITASNDAIDLIKLYYDGTNYLATFDQDFQ